MFLRALVLTILIICTVAATLPVSDSLAHWSARPSASRRYKGRYARPRSRAWWRRYRARLRRQRAVAAERRRRRAAVAARRAAAAKALALANHATIGNTNALGLPAVVLPDTASLSSITPVNTTPVVAPLNATPAAAAPAPMSASKEMPKIAAAPAASVAAVSPLPAGWTNAVQAGRVAVTGEQRFNVRAADGRMRASAVWSRVNVQSAAPSPTDARSKTFGGVPVTLLRRTVINRMVSEGGWVINDVQRQFGERRVFIVTAQSLAANGERRSWTFYFTESSGQVYSLATNAPSDLADALAPEAEQAVVALGSRGSSSGPATANYKK